MDLCHKATQDAQAACSRTAALLSDPMSGAMIFLYAAGVLIGEAGGRFSAAQQVEKEEATEAVFEILRELMGDRDAFFAKLNAAQTTN